MGFNFYLRGMSSHHIVREKQEPALYIHQFTHFDEEHLGQLLEWSPTLLVAASAYEKVISLGLKVDVVIGSDTQLQLQENTKSMVCPEETIQQVLKYLIAEAYPAVNIIGTQSKFDDLIDFLPAINLVLFTPSEKSYAIKSGFSVWKPAGTVFKMDSHLTFEATNLQELEKGNFVVQQDGFVGFNFKTDYLFLIELI